MPSVDRLLSALMMLVFAAGVMAAPANPPAYGKVDTFEPGKKYNCVPSADRKSWNCAQTGKATDGNAPPPHDAPAAAAPANPQPPAHAAPPPPSAPAPAPAATAATAAAPRASELPTYLKASSASPPATSPGPVAAAPPVPVPAAVARESAPVATPKPAPAPVVQTPTNPQRAPVATVPPPAPKPAPPVAKPAAKPAGSTVTAPPAAPTPARSPAPAQSRAPAYGSTGGFLDLPGDHYVIELAHAERETDIAAARASLHLPRGEIYELHLRQNGGDVWLLVWGSFADVGAARGARGELPADAHAGWPRRVAPLQAEVRRVQE